MGSSKGLVIILLTFVLWLSGCSKVTLANYDRVEMGMIKSDVEMILGKPDHCEAVTGSFSCLWGDEKEEYIKVHYIAQRAAVITQGGLK